MTPERLAEIRCERTGHPCGTDTLAVGHGCCDRCEMHAALRAAWREWDAWKRECIKVQEYAVREFKRLEQERNAARAALRGMVDTIDEGIAMGHFSYLAQSVLTSVREAARAALGEQP